jgi:hypothetical protein
MLAFLSALPVSKSKMSRICNLLRQNLMIIQ